MRKYMNRELSWLKFNERVLEEAENKKVPLCERLNFAAIYQSNLDEFFMVRVGSLVDQMLLKKGFYAKVNLKQKKAQVYAKEQISTQEIQGIVRRSGYDPGICKKIESL